LLSVVLSFEEAEQLLQAAQAEEARCQSRKSRSERQLEDAATQLAEAERQLFDAQLNLGHIRYILRKSDFQLPEPCVPNQLRNVIQIDGGECRL
jgi:hypothetical protein